MTARFSSVVRSVTWGLFLAQLFLAVCLPGGAVFGLNLKFISSLLLLVAFVIYLATGGAALSCADVIFMAVVAALLCFWSLVGVLVGKADPLQMLSELKAIILAIIIAWLSIFAIRRRLVTAERLITVIIYGMFCLSAVKLVIAVGSFFYYFDPIQTTKSLFGETSVTAYPIFVAFVRLMFPVDILGAFVVFALLAPSVSGVRFGRMSKLFICMVVILGSGLLAYARFVWLVYAVSIFLAMIVERKWKTMVVTAIAVTALFVSFHDAVNEVIEDRFVSEADLSDSGRTKQAQAMKEEILARPILGKGMGAHALGCIRSDTELYSYELQWMAFLMQFGIVGEAGILLLVAAAARDLMMAKHPAKPWVLLLFLLWLLASWTNPYLTSSFAGATFGFFMAMFYRTRNPNLKGVRTICSVVGVPQTVGAYEVLGG